MSGWKENTIEEVTDRIATGKTPPTSNKEYFDGNINWYTPQDILNTIALNGSSRKISSKAFEDRKAILFEPNTLLITCIGNVGRIGLTTVPSSSNQQITGLKFKPFIYPKYAFYYFQYIQPQLADQANNAVVPILNNGTLKEFKIRYPDLHTQKQIAQLLEEIDIARQKRKVANALTDQFLQSTFLSMFGDPVANPKNWEQLLFKEVGTLDRGRSKHRPRNAPELLGGVHPLIQTGDVSNCSGYIYRYSQTYSDIGLKQSKMWSEGTLCITIAANIAKTGILTFDSCFPDSIVGFAPNKKVTTEYIQYWLSFLQKTLEENAPESAQKNINLDILRNLKVPVAPIDLQQKFTSIVADTEQLSQKQKQSEIELENLFQALLQKYFG